MSEFKSPYKKLNRKVNTWCIYTDRLDTYGNGCVHDCKYCYAKSLLSFRNFWGKPCVSNLGVIGNEISKLSPGIVLRMGGMTDCFQPIELTHRVTYNTIKLLNKYKINYLIVTKSDLVANDEYIDIYNKDLAHFQISLSSTDERKCCEYEKASSPYKRISAIEKLSQLGFDVSIRLSPLLYEHTDFNIINKIKCNKILIEFLKVNPFIRKSFDIDYSSYTLKKGGFCHLTLDHKIKLVNNITKIKQVSVGEYVEEHHQYFKENVNYNKNDCCNLSLKPVYFPRQLKLFDYAEPQDVAN